MTMSMSGSSNGGVESEAKVARALGSASPVPLASDRSRIGRRNVICMGRTVDHAQILETMRSHRQRRRQYGGDPKEDILWIS